MGLLWIILVILLALVALSGFALAAYSMRIKGQTLEQARKWQESHYALDWYDAMEKVDYEVTGEDGYVLHAQLLPCPEASDRYMILSHGYTDNRIGSLKYTRLYLSLGFNVLLYDLRGHGLNAPTFCTYSVREARDLDAMVRDARRRHPDLKMLGLHGESLGAATTVAVLKYRPAIDFAVADCGFAEIESILRAGLRHNHIPEGMVRLCALCAKIRYGYTYSQMRPIDSLASSAVPILFIHGTADGFIPSAHSEAMCRAAGPWGELRLIPGAKHAASIFTDPVQYREAVETFIQRVGGRR